MYSLFLFVVTLGLIGLFLRPILIGAGIVLLVIIVPIGLLAGALGIVALIEHPEVVQSAGTQLIGAAIVIVPILALWADSWRRSGTRLELRHDERWDVRQIEQRTSATREE